MDTREECQMKDGHSEYGNGHPAKEDVEEDLSSPAIKECNKSCKIDMYQKKSGKAEVNRRLILIN